MPTDTSHPYEDPIDRAAALFDQINLRLKDADQFGDPEELQSMIDEWFLIAVDIDGQPLSQKKQLLQLRDRLQANVHKNMEKLDIDPRIMIINTQRLFEAQLSGVQSPVLRAMKRKEMPLAEVQASMGSMWPEIQKYVVHGRETQAQACRNELNTIIGDTFDHSKPYKDIEMSIEQWVVKVHRLLPRLGKNTPNDALKEAHAAVFALGYFLKQNLVFQRRKTS